MDSLTPITSELLATALQYATDGWPVFPCLEERKEPACPNGFKDATTDPDVIRAWWNKNPSYNVAIVPADAGWTVVDIDEKHGKEGEKHWSEFLAAQGLTEPETYQVRTPSGGRHLYFEGSGPSTVDKIATGVDTRSKAGYVLVPPSVVDGKPYEAVNAIEVAPLPDAVAAILNKAPEAKEPSPKQGDPLSLSQLRTMLCHLDPGIGYEPWRNIIAAIRATPGPDDGDLLQTALAWSQGKLDSSGRYKVASPPNYTGDADVEKAFATLPPREAGITVGTLINEARAAGYSGPISIADEKALAEIKRQFAEAALNAAPDTVAPSNKSFRLMSPDEFDQGEDARWIVKGFLYERAWAMHYGNKGSLKTFTALDLCLSIATGAPFLGETVPTITGPAIFIAGEAPETVRKRRVKAWVRKRLGDDGALIGKPFYIIPVMPCVTVTDQMRALEAAIVEKLGPHTYPVVIAIDTWARFVAGSNENDTQATGDVVQIVDSLRRRFRCAFIEIHHARKQGADADGPIVARGNTAHDAAVDIIWRHTRPDPTIPRVELFCEKMRDDEDGETISVEGEKIELGKNRDGDPVSSLVVKISDQMAISRDDAKNLRIVVEALYSFGSTPGVYFWQTSDLAAKLVDAESIADETPTARATRIATKRRRLNQWAKSPAFSQVVNRAAKGTRDSARWGLPANAHAQFPYLGRKASELVSSGKSDAAIGSSACSPTSMNFTPSHFQTDPLPTRNASAAPNAPYRREAKMI
ncbi:MAG: bifunctional DNA primase/polymerase [Stellaceae bacterium]